MLKNEKGSVMSVAIIMIALLSFAVTSVSAYSYRTAANTNRIVEDNESTNQAKRLISEAMAQFREKVDELVADHGTDIISEQEKETFDEEMDATYEDIKTRLGVEIREAPERFDSSSVSTELNANAFRFSFSLGNDRDMVKYLFLTDYEVEWEAYDAFEYSIGSSANVVINGGHYENSTDIYGDYLYNSYNTAIPNDDGDGYTVEEAGTDNYPSGEVHFTSPNRYQCEVPSVCLDISDDGNNHLEIDHEKYKPVDNGDSNYFSDLLLGFDYDRTFYKNLETSLETDAFLDENTYLDHLNDGVDDGTYIGLTNDSETEPFIFDSNNKDLLEENHVVVDSENTEIDMDGGDLDLYDKTLIILGDLTIDNVGEINSDFREITTEDEETENISGQIYVFGDIVFDNNQDLKTNANYFSTGDIDVAFEGGEGFTLYGSGANNEGMSLFAGGNISINYSNTPTSGNARFALFLMAQGSIRIDSATDILAMGGAMYAAGEGEGFDDIRIINKDGNDEPENFRGIIINSLNPSGNYEANDDTGNNGQGGGNDSWVNPGGGNPNKDKGNSNKKSDHYFSFYDLTNSAPGEDNATPQENLRNSFDALPDFQKLRVEPDSGELISDTSTFLYETSDPED